MARLLLFALVVLVACDKPQPIAAAAPAAPPVSSVVASASPEDALNRLDVRKPVPLLPMMANHQKQNMRDHLLAVQEIVAALASDDFAGVEKAAGRMGFSEQMGQMCTHMGAGASGFTDEALAFHHTADGISEAARKRDRNAVVKALGATLQACTACHATWRQQVVDESTWNRVTASAVPIGHSTPR